MSYEQALNQLAGLYGIQSEYWDVQGVCQRASLQTKAKILSALGVAAANEAEALEAIRKYSLESWQEVLPPVAVFFQSNLPVRLALSGLAPEACFSWALRCEDGSEIRGDSVFKSLNLLESCELEGQYFERREFRIERELSLGYHQLSIELGEQQYNCSLIVAPERCYQLSSPAAGISTQLYSLRTERNWGIGDLSDLLKQLKPLHSSGVELLGLNPLHALFEADSENVSPYSPCSRLARSILILDCERVPEFSWVKPPESGTLEMLRQETLVNYAKVWELKLSLLREMYQEFKKRHILENTRRAAAFDRYKQSLPERARLHAVFSALREELLKRDSACNGYPAWPEEFRKPESESVKSFEKEHEDSINFFHYTQWQIEEQLRELALGLKQESFKVGLYLDLALGANSWGSEVWSQQSAYCLGLSMGAPPDELGPKGQDWGLPPFHPQALRQAAYRPFIEVLQFNMRYAGALRIDHVMSLFRLYCIPQGAEASEGAYLRYAFQELLAIVCLESHRNKCVVIGEDLGTVPAEVGQGMSSSGMLSYKVLYFERKQFGFKSPREYQAGALVVASTHDLPTLKSYWKARDIALRQSLGLYLDESLIPGLYAERENQKKELLTALLNEGISLQASVEELCESELSEELCKKLYQYLKLTPCILRTVQLEDAMLESYQANVPGTVNEHPNWRAKHSKLFDQEFIETLSGYV